MKPDLMVAMEAVSLAFLLVVISAYIFLPRSRPLKKDSFFFSLILAFLGLLFDMVAWACELAPSPMFIQYSSNYFALVMTCFIISAFGYYIIDLINENKQLSEYYAHSITIINILGVIVTTVAAIKWKLFDVNPDPALPGVLVYDSGGFFYEFPMVLTTLSLLLLFILVLVNSKALGWQRVAVFSIYFLIPLIAGALEMIYDDFQLSYIASAVSMSIVYVLLQSSHLNELMLREKVLNEVSYVDQLTGLLNRRAYDRDVNNIKKDDTVSIAFCDLNGLKRVNDEKGHSAGDQYLITFSNIITNNFPHDSVYRISGDEFVVVARDMDKESFDMRVERLRDEINENSGIAALGTISGMGDTIPELVKEAEMSMYADKKYFYSHNPEYKRGKSAYMNS